MAGGCEKLLGEQITKMIETERLYIKPLIYDQLVKYIAADNSLEAELNLNPTSRSISPELKEAFEQTILPNVADKTKNYLFSTLWTAILKSDNKMIGDICFIGEPNAEGEVEIGYGTYQEFRGRGYTTEIVKGIISWAKTQLSVKSIIASTDNTNTGSFKVLEKNGFLKIDETENLFNYKLTTIRNNCKKKNENPQACSYLKKLFSYYYFVDLYKWK